MEVEDIRKEARSFFGEVKPSHDWLHVERVEKLALKIAEEENADIQTVRLGVLLHDIGRYREDQGKIDDHAEWGAKRAADVLREHGYGDGTAEKVRHCIRSHRYSTEPEPETLEAKVISDADNLDALGATGIARAFCVAGERNNALADPDIPAGKDVSEARKTALNHLQKKILSLKDRMYTETGHELARERHDFVESFVERLEEEIKGEL